MTFRRIDELAGHVIRRVEEKTGLSAVEALGARSYRAVQGGEYTRAATKRGEEYPLGMHLRLVTVDGRRV
jgi:hypothetical protein